MSGTVFFKTKSVSPKNRAEISREATVTRGFLAKQRGNTVLYREAKDPATRFHSQAAVIDQTLPGSGRQSKIEEGSDRSERIARRASSTRRSTLLPFRRGTKPVDRKLRRKEAKLFADAKSPGGIRRSRRTGVSDVEGFSGSKAQ